MIRQEKEIKGIQIGKEEAKLLLFADDIIVHIENPTDSTKKRLNLINESGKMVGYKVNIQKLKTFLYPNNEISETEIRGEIPLPIPTRKIKYLGINLTKEVKDLCSENYTTLKKEIKEDKINGSMYHAHGLEELISSKCPYHPKQFIHSTQLLLK